MPGRQVHVPSSHVVGPRKSPQAELEQSTPVLREGQRSVPGSKTGVSISAATMQVPACRPGFVSWMAQCEGSQWHSPLMHVVSPRQEPQVLNAQSPPVVRSSQSGA